MAEYIERELVYKAVFAEMMDSDVPEVIDAVSSLDLRIGSIPSADVKPVVRGEWEQIEIIDDDSPSGVNDDVARCKNCGYQETAGLYWAQTYLHYCPNCGADMRGKQ